jgi:proteasome lid subunit RPN8/RPN11
MFRGLAGNAKQWLDDLHQTLLRRRGAVLSPRTATPAPIQYVPLEGIRLTDGVGRTLFEEYAAHRQESRGEEETGWILLGLREAAQAVVLATLPAGALRDASATHIRFNSLAQSVGSRIVRQAERRLTILGLVHTHPGSLRHPSDGDYKGDSQWVKNLRGAEGIFGIGTADAQGSGGLFADQPKPHVQALGELRLTWYSLQAGAANYRPLPVLLTIGPDLARPLHSVWPTIEAHAERLERLARQQSRVTFGLVEQDGNLRLTADLPLAESDVVVRAVMSEKEVTYFVIRDGAATRVDCGEYRVDRGVYLLLADLAAAD